MAPVAISAPPLQPEPVFKLKAEVAEKVLFCPYNTHDQWVAENPDKPPAKYPHYLPYDDDEGVPVHGEFKHIDPASRADPKMPNLLKEDVIVQNLTPILGTTISGVQLTRLSKASLDEVALLAAQRGILVFKNQDLKDAGPQKAVEIGSHFGPLHKHPIMWHVKDFMDLQIVYEGPEVGGLKTRIEHDVANVMSSCSWHSDQSHEPQPPAVSLLAALELPAGGGGGDTIFSSTTACYDALSPTMQKFVDQLWIEHTSKRQTARSVAIGGVARKQGASVFHPLVTVHPVTGKKALFVNKSFSGQIYGMKKEESENLLQFLANFVQRAQEFQCRVQWEEGAVAVYDQRVLQHSRTIDYPIGSRRHLMRITPLGGRPIATPAAGGRPDFL